MKTYVTLLSTENYLPGALALHASMRRVESSHPLLVALSPSIAPPVAALLRGAGMQVLTLQRGLDLPQMLRERSGYWGHTFDKVQLFGLTDYEKLVYVDSDMMVLANIDALFDKPHMSAVAAGQLVHADWRRLNSGLMVIEPDRRLPAAIAGSLESALAYAAATGSSRIGDQDLINAYYATWPDTVELHLDEGYNVFHSHLDEYIERYDYRLPQPGPGTGRLVRLMHFIGARKPWMQGALARHWLEVVRLGGAAQWEHKLFAAYRSLLHEARVAIR
jgi:glycogenin glucosyltransferase